MCNYFNFDIIKQNNANRNLFIIAKLNRSILSFNPGPVMALCLYFMVVTNLNSNFAGGTVDKSFALRRFAQELVSP